MSRTDLGICTDCLKDKENCYLEAHDEESCNCNSANKETSGSFWGDGNFRCEACSDKRRIELHTERARLNDAAVCEECGVKTGDIGLELCERCCDHQDICYDERGCLVCGKDMTEDIMSRAYDRAKDARKYGE